MLKHAPQCPESAAALQQIFLDAGYPEGAYVNVYASNEQIEQVIADPRVQGVSLTGSERAGAAVAEIAGRNLKKVVLELGGSDPFIVLGTDDLDATVEAAVAARMENTGQACNAGKRMIVHESLYDDFVAKFTEKMLGQRARPAVLARRRRAARAAGRGCGLRGGEPRDDRRARRRALPGGRAHRRRSRQRGLPRGALRPGGDGVQGQRRGGGGRASPTTRRTAWAPTSTPTDPEQAARVADQLDAGMVFVNGVGAEGAELPFGGVKRSGFGRELGSFGIDEFVNKKLIRTVR